MKRSLFAILFILCAISAFALTEDFTASAPSTVIKGTACNIYTSPLTITNTGDVTSTYTIEVTGEAAKWVNYATNFLVLEKGQKETIPLFINLPCKVEGDFELTTTITTGFDLQKELTQTIQVINPVNFYVQSKTLNRVLEPCTPTSYEFEVMNTGEFLETFKFSLLNSPTYATLSTDVAVLKPGEKTTIYAYLNPSCDIYGVQELTLVTNAQRSGYEARTNFALGIKRTYNYTIIAPQQVNACEEVTTPIPVTIKNTNRIGNKYVLDVKGPTFVELVNNTLIVQPKQSATTQILVNTPDWNEKDNRTQTIILTATSQRGDVQKQHNITLYAEHCYDANIVLENKDYVAVEGESISFPLIIQDTGSRTVETSLELKAANWLSLNQTSFKINASDYKEVQLLAQVPVNATAQKVTLIATILDLNKTIEKTFDIDVIPPEKAYLIGIDKDGKDEEGNTIITITHKGVRSAIYDLTLEGPQGMTLSKKSVELNPNEKTQVLLKTSDLYGKYAITLTAQTNDLIYQKSLTVTAGEYKSPYRHLLWIIPALIILFLGVFFFTKWLKKRREENYFITKTKESSKKKWLLLALLALILLIGAIIAITQLQQTPSSPSEEEQNLFAIEPPVQTIIVDGEEQIIMNLTVYNPTDQQATFRVRGDSDWVEVEDRSFSVSPHATHTTQLIITPDYDVLATSSYKVSITGHLENDEINYTQSVTHTIKGKEHVAVKLLPWMVAGILIVGLVILVSLLGKQEHDDEETEEKTQKKRTSKKETKKTQSEVSTFVIPWKYVLIGLVILALLVLLIFAISKVAPLLVTGVNHLNDGIMPSEKNADENSQDIRDPILSVDRSHIAGSGNVLKIRPDETVKIPLNVHNPTDKKARITISIKTNGLNDSWIALEDDSFIIYPQDTHETLITITPQANILEEQDYTLTITSNLNNEFAEQLDLIITKKAVIPLWVYALIGVLIVGLVILIRERKTRRKTRKTKISL
ncbi:hypothetical protein D6774_01645 [Candidatus Woesearchaeota archaeon]|nr:MAG: hypothetical protein D6774_01645 [Candidatus Woesearchaeota archaeon]